MFIWYLDGIIFILCSQGFNNTFLWDGLNWCLKLHHIKSHLKNFDGTVCVFVNVSYENLFMTWLLVTNLRDIVIGDFDVLKCVLQITFSLHHYMPCFVNESCCLWHMLHINNVQFYYDIAYYWSIYCTEEVWMFISVVQCFVLLYHPFAGDHSWKMGMCNRQLNRTNVYVRI